MERRVLIAIVASFLVIYLWQALFMPAAPPAPTPSPAETAQGTPGPGGAGGAGGAGARDLSGQPALVDRPNPSAPDLQAGPAGEPIVAEAAEREVRVETNDVVAVFTNRGARIKSWRLKHYGDQSGQPQELVEQPLPPNQPLPFSLAVADQAATRALNSGLYQVTGAPAASPITSAVDLTFEYSDSTGLHAVKTFRLEPSSYVVSLKPSVSIGGQAVSPQIQWGPGLGDREIGSSSAALAGGLVFQAGDEERLPAAAVVERPVYEGAFQYVGIDTHYFTSVAINPGAGKATFQPVTIPASADGLQPERQVMAYSLDPATPPAEPLRFYVGPKDFDQLAKVDRDLVRIIHFGVFGFIVVPLLRSLKWINQYVGNYGWSIIVLTAIINLLTLPLRHKAVVSMRKMQEIQPEAKAIQERYAKLKATDPAKQKMNQELMGLYRERGVNPASGCVPMLIPFPVLIAFYSLLTVAIELRGAPFLGWIQDLSAPDPLYITPILMGASQLWQQWIQPAAGMDPTQRKMMLVMPVIFTFLFLGYPAGLTLYWFASNLWGIGQQYLTNYLIGPPNIRSVRPAAERRVKRVGAGKTEAAARED